MPVCERPEGCTWPNHADMCTTSCYARYTRRLTAQWDAEDAEREARGKYLGCPVCKQRVRFSCYHDGQSISSRELPLPVPPRPPTLDEALGLLEDISTGTRRSGIAMLRPDLRTKLDDLLERARVL